MSSNEQDLCSLYFISNFWQSKNGIIIFTQQAAKPILDYNLI